MRKSSVDVTGKEMLLVPGNMLKITEENRSEDEEIMKQLGR